MIGRALAAALLAVACSSSPKPAGPTPPPGGDTRPAAARPITDQELTSAVIAAVEIRGLARIGESRARLAIAVAKGDRFDRTKIRESLRQLMTIRGVADARAVAFRTDTGGLGVAFVVVESPPVKAVTVSGNQAVNTSELLSTANLEVGAPLDPVAAQKAALAIKARYQSIGHYRAEVDWKASAGEVSFAVREGPRASIKTISFPGAKALAGPRLAKLMTEASPENTAGGVFVRSAIDAALPRITAAYYDIGHIDVSVGPAAVATPTPEAIEVTIPIREGEQFRLGKLSVTGKLSGPAKSYLRRLGLRTGKVFSRAEITAAIKRLAEHHQKRTSGPAPNVTPLTTVDKEKRRIDIAFDIE